MEKLNIYACSVDEEDGNGIFAVSFVKVPANKTNFVAMAAAKKQAVKMHADTAKQILTGPILIPDQVIYRNDNQLGEYYITFSAAEIEKIAAKMMRKNIALSTTTHLHATPLKGNYLLESWIVADPLRDKSAVLGFNVPKGTLMASYKISDANYWRNEVQTGNVKGFSLEGFFNFSKLNNVNMNKQTKPARKSGLATLLHSIGAFLDDTQAAADTLATDEAPKDTTGSADPVLAFTLEDGTDLLVDAEGNATVNGAPASPGEHTLQDGNVITIDADSKFVATDPASSGTAPAAPTAAALAEAKKLGAAYLAALPKPAVTPEAIAAAFAAMQKQPATPETLAAVLAAMKQPTAKPAKAADATGATVELSAEDFAKLTPTERIAYTLRLKHAKNQK